MILLASSHHPLWDAVLPPLLAACVSGTAIIVAAVLASGGVSRTIQEQRRAADIAVIQEWEADRQTAWWSRAEWALTQALRLENDRAVVLGMATLFGLQTRPAADGDELILRRILALAAQDPTQIDLAELRAQVQTGSRAER